MGDDRVLDLLLRANNRRRRGETDVRAERALEDAFGCSQRLAAYGTLAPGQPNHGVLAACAGEWCPADVTGRRGMRAYPVFTWSLEGRPQRIWLLTSSALPAAWPRIDEFEGGDYRRILVPVIAASQRTVANLYEALAPVRPEEDRADEGRT